MPNEYLVQVQNAERTAVIESQRKPVDIVRAQQWLILQAAQAAAGNLLLLQTQEAGQAVPAGWPNSLLPVPAEPGGGGEEPEEPAPFIGIQFTVWDGTSSPIDKIVYIPADGAQQGQEIEFVKTNGWPTVYRATNIPHTEEGVIEVRGFGQPNNRDGFFSMEMPYIEGDGTDSRTYTVVLSQTNEGTIWALGDGDSLWGFWTPPPAGGG